MSKILFTKEDIIKLEKNKNIFRVSERSITYTMNLRDFLLKNIWLENYLEKYFLKMDLILI